MASLYRKRHRNGKLDKAWRFKYKDFAGRWRYGIGWPDKLKTTQHAQELEAEHRAIRNGEKPFPSQRRNGLTEPVAQVISDYLAWGKTQGGRGGRPWDDQNARLKKNYLDWWVQKLHLDVLGDIQLDPVEKVVTELVDAGDLAPKSVALRVEPLRCLCLWAVRRGLLPANPLASLGKINTRPQDPHRALTDSEVVSLLTKARAHRRLWYEVALQTG
jgi:hypothetical protein